MREPPLSATPQEFDIKPRTDGKRIDSYLASRFSDYSRSVIQKVIEACAAVGIYRIVVGAARPEPTG